MFFVQANDDAEGPVTRMEILDAITDAFASPPATKDQIVAAAEDSRSRRDLVALLSQLPNSTFSDVRDLWSYLPDVPVDVT